MSPRPYRAGRRQEAAEQTRARILTAARELLTTGESLAGFSIDAVARQADVARMTVYYQFSSRAGLLEALFDDLAARGGMDRLRDAFRQPDPLVALDGFIATFCRFYGSARPVIQRLRGLAVLDPELDQAHRARNERRREGLRVIVRRLMERDGRPAPEACDETIDILHTLTSFETFDGLAGATRGADEVARIVQALARAALGLHTR